MRLGRRLRRHQQFMGNLAKTAGLSHRGCRLFLEGAGLADHFAKACVEELLAAGVWLSI